MRTSVIVATGGVAVTALALAAVTEARYENPSLAEAREAATTTGASAPDEPTRRIDLPVAMHGPAGAGD